MNNFVADQGSTGNTIIDVPTARQEGPLVLPFPAQVVDKGPNITVFPEYTSEAPTILDTPATVKEELYVETFPAAESKSVEDMILKSDYRIGDKTPKGRTFTNHGAERANERGFEAQVIDNIIDNNKAKRVKEIDEDGQVTWRYQDKRGNTVITNEWSDSIITVYSHPKDINNGKYIPKIKIKK